MPNPEITTTPIEDYRDESAIGSASSLYTRINASGEVEIVFVPANSSTLNWARRDPDTETGWSVTIPPMSLASGLCEITGAPGELAGLGHFHRDPAIHGIFGMSVLISFDDASAAVTQSDLTEVSFGDSTTGDGPVYGTLLDAMYTADTDNPYMIGCLVNDTLTDLDHIRFRGATDATGSMTTHGGVMDQCVIYSPDDPGTPFAETVISLALTPTSQILALSLVRDSTYRDSVPLRHARVVKPNLGSAPGCTKKLLRVTMDGRLQLWTDIRCGSDESSAIPGMSYKEMTIPLEPLTGTDTQPPGATEPPALPRPVPIRAQGAEATDGTLHIVFSDTLGWLWHLTGDPATGTWQQCYPIGVIAKQTDPLFSLRLDGDGQPFVGADSLTHGGIIAASLRGDGI